MSVAILRQGDYLIASIQSDLTDSEVFALRDDLTRRVGENRVRGIVIDVAALDVIDSFVARALRAIALTARLRGAETVIVGIQPDVAIAMVQFRLEPRAAPGCARPGRGLGMLDRRTQGTRRWTMRCASPSTSDADLVDGARRGPRDGRAARVPAGGPDAHRDGDLRDRAQHRRARRPRRDRDAALRGPTAAACVVAADHGPGIRDIDAALSDGSASRGGLGLGLPGARRLMDEFELDSDAGARHASR